MGWQTDSVRADAQRSCDVLDVVWGDATKKSPPRKWIFRSTTHCFPSALMSSDKERGSEEGAGVQPNRRDKRQAAGGGRRAWRGGRATGDRATGVRMLSPVTDARKPTESGGAAVHTPVPLVPNIVATSTEHTLRPECTSANAAFHLLLKPDQPRARSDGRAHQPGPPTAG